MMLKNLIFPQCNIEISCHFFCSIRVNLFFVRGKNRGEHFRLTLLPLYLENFADNSAPLSRLIRDVLTCSELSGILICGCR